MNFPVRDTKVLLYCIVLYFMVLYCMVLLNYQSVGLSVSQSPWLCPVPALSHVLATILLIRSLSQLLTHSAIHFN